MTTNNAKREFFSIVWLLFSGLQLFGQVPQKNILYLNARAAENRVCILSQDDVDNRLNAAHTPVCPLSVSFGGSLDASHSSDLVITNRKFLSTYEVTINKEVPSIQNPIRNLDEASNLTLGGGTILTGPPSKGNINALSQRNTVDIFGLLADESTAEQPRAALESEYQEIVRERAQVIADINSLECQYELLMGSAALPGGVTCTGANGNTIADIVRKLSQELAWDRGTAWPDGSNPFPIGVSPYIDENKFKVMLIRVQLLLPKVTDLSAHVAQANLGPTVLQLDAEVSQFEKNVDTFQANVRATMSAIGLYQAIAGSVEARRILRRAELKKTFKTLLKSAAGDATPVIDDGELNVLLEHYLDALERGNGFALADASVRTLGQEAVCLTSSRIGPHAVCVVPPGWSAPVNIIERGNIVSYRTSLDALELGILSALPNQIALVNRLQSELVDRMNSIYDDSAVPTPEVELVNLTRDQTSKFVYYSIYRVENFIRFTVQSANPPTTALVSTVTPLQSASSLQSATTVPNVTTTTAGTGSGTTIAANGTPSMVTPTTTVVVQSAKVEFHAYDLAAVIAGYAFSSFRNNSYTAQQVTFSAANPPPTSGPCKETTPGDITTAPACYTAVRTSSTYQPQVMLGLMIYPWRRDTFQYSEGPRALHNGLQKLAVAFGVSLNTLNNYFTGAVYEPTIGFNLGFGAQFGSESRVQPGTTANMNLFTGTTVPTYDKRIIKPYFSLGLDLPIFRKIFGKTTGLGVSTGTASTP